MNLNASMLELARNPSAEARAKLAQDTAEAFLSTPRDYSETEITLFDEVFCHLYPYTKGVTKYQLSSTMALASWAPQKLLRELANDNFELSSPILSHSLVISDATLLEIIGKKPIAYQLCVAARPNLGENITHALIDKKSAQIVSVLAANYTAKISAADFAIAVEIVKSDVKSIDNLAGRSDLPDNMVKEVHALASDAAKAKLEIMRQIKPTATAPSTNASKKPANTEINFVETGPIIDAIKSGVHSNVIKEVSAALEISPATIFSFICGKTPDRFAIIARALELRPPFAFSLLNIFDKTANVDPKEYKSLVDNTYNSHSASSAKTCILGA